MDLVAVGVREPPRAVRLTLRSALTLRFADDLARRRAARGRRLRPARELVPDLPVGTDAGAADRSRRVGDRFERRTGSPIEREPVQFDPTLVVVQDQQRRTVRPPAGHRDVAGEVHVQVVALPGGEVPDAGALDPLPLVVERQTHIPGYGRPPAAGQSEPLTVPLLPERRARHGVHHAEREVDVVAEFGMLDREQRPVARDPRHVQDLRMRIDRLRGLLAPCSPDREPRLGSGADHRHAVAERDAGGPRVRDAVDERPALAGVAVERLGHPVADLAARLVVEPDDALAVQGREAVDHADRMVGHLPPDTAAAVPRVHLVGAALVRDHGQPVGGLARPAREQHHGRSEAPFPCGHLRRMVADGRVHRCH